jgi:hypothetical protein
VTLPPFCLASCKSRAVAWSKVIDWVGTRLNAN